MAKPERDGHLEAAHLNGEWSAVRSRALVAKPGRGTARPHGVPPECHCGRLASRDANLSQCQDKVGQLVHAGGDRSRIRIDIRHRMHQAADQSVILSAGDFNGD